MRGEEELARAARWRTPRPCAAGSRRRSGPRTGVLRDGARRGEAAGRRDRLERRATACGRGIASPDRAPARRRPPDGARHVQRLGDPHVRLGPAGLQPDRLPHGHGLAARRVADRRGLQALRPARGGEPPRRADLRGRPALRRTSACRSCSAASTATTRRFPSRTPSPARRRPGPPAPLFLFIETMLGLRAARRPPRAGARAARAARTGSRR